MFGIWRLLFRTLNFSKHHNGNSFVFVSLLRPEDRGNSRFLIGLFDASFPEKMAKNWANSQITFLIILYTSDEAPLVFRRFFLFFFLSADFSS